MIFGTTIRVSIKSKLECIRSRIFDELYTCGNHVRYTGNDTEYNITIHDHRQLSVISISLFEITKLSKYEDMKETIRILHDLLKEYKQDTGPVDELSVAFSNVETRKELFEKAYRYNTELPMVMYCS